MLAICISANKGFVQTLKCLSLNFKFPLAQFSFYVVKTLLMLRQCISNVPLSICYIWHIQIEHIRDLWNLKWQNFSWWWNCVYYIIYIVRKCAKACSNLNYSHLNWPLAKCHSAFNFAWESLINGISVFSPVFFFSLYLNGFLNRVCVQRATLSSCGCWPFWRSAKKRVVWVDLEANKYIQMCF